MSLLRLIHRYWPSNKYLDQYSIAAIHTPPRPISFLSPTYPSSTQRHIPRKCECLPSTPLILSLSLALPPDPPQSYIHFVSHYRQAAGRCSDSATTPFWELVPVANASGQGSCSPARNLEEERRFTTPRLWTQPTAGSKTTCFDAR